MKLGVMIYSVFSGIKSGRWTAKQAVREIVDAGVSGLEIPSGGWQDSLELWDDFLHIAKDAGMVNICYDAIINLIGESREDRDRAIESALTHLTRAQEVFACPTILFAGTKPAEGMSNEEGRKVYGDQLARIVAGAKGHDITITIEDYGVYPAFTAAADHCLEVLENAGGGVRLTYDNGNFLLGDDQPMDVYSRLLPLSSHVHIKDLALCPPAQAVLTSPAGNPYKSCPIGQGNAQVRECVAQLARDDYRDWVSIEVGGGNALKGVVEAADVIRRAWEEA